MVRHRLSDLDFEPDDSDVDAMLERKEALRRKREGLLEPDLTPQDLTPEDKGEQLPPKGEVALTAQIDAHVDTLLSLGFTILPVRTGEKNPSGQDWKRATKNDPHTFLRNPGTQNYGILPPPGVFAWDVDKDVPEFIREKSADLGFLPLTRTHKSPRGLHQFYRWPPDLPRPKGPMFGKVVTRWPFGDEGQGYLVGPGSRLDDGGEYSVYLDEPIADFPLAWAVAAQNGPRTPETPESGLFAQPRIGEGLRHDWLRDRARELRGRGLTGQVLFDAVWQQYEERCEPYPAYDPTTRRKPEDQVRAAIGDVETKFGVDADLVETPVVSSEEVFDPHATLLTAIAGDLPWLIDEMVTANGLTVMSGHPKSGKTLALMQAGCSWVSGQTFLGAPPDLSRGRVFLYVTEEGSRALMRDRILSLTRNFPRLDGENFGIAYLKGLLFDTPSFVRIRNELATKYGDGSRQVLLAFDPLRDFMPSGVDENESKAMGEVKHWCRTLLSAYPWLSIVLIHHDRKTSEGKSGLDMAGSGALFGAVDGVINWNRKHHAIAGLGEDDEGESESLFRTVVPFYGEMKVDTRGGEGYRVRWEYERATGLFVRAAKAASAESRTGASIEAALTAAGSAGLTVRDIEVACGVSTSAVRGALARLRSRGLVVASTDIGRSEPMGAVRWWWHSTGPETETGLLD